MISSTDFVSQLKCASEQTFIRMVHPITISMDQGLSNCDIHDFGED